MGLNRMDVIRKINLFSSENNQDALIKLLCEILNDNQFKNDNIDLIHIIISIGELYGFYSYIGNEEKEFDLAEKIRKNMYESFDKKIHYNSGQLSLLNEMKSENKLFISAPTSFGKTKLVLDYIASENQNLNNILFLIPTNSLSEEIYIKLLTFNHENNLSYHITTAPKINHGNNILILTPEKYLLLLESKDPEFDLYIMDESYKIEESNENNNSSDPLNTRSSKFRRIMEIIASKSGKTIYLSPFTYITDDSMDRFLNKYDIRKIDRKENYVQKNLIKVDDSRDYKYIINKNVNGYRKDLSGVKKASFLMKDLEQNTIVYVRYPKEALEFIKNINMSINIDSISERFRKFIKHIEDTYEFDGSNWYILEGLKKGIGVYVSPMPRYIKREIVKLFNDGILNILVVTSAFAEGVNSSAKNIIITNDVVGSNVKMTALDLLNLSGRAGRFGVHSQGNVYSVKTDIHNRLEDCIDKGVKISNSNYEGGRTDKTRAIYDIEKIDISYLNSEELDIRNSIESLQKELGLSDADLNVALSVSKYEKIILYKYFQENGEIERNNDRINVINNILSEERNDIVASMKYIFDELKAAEIKIASDEGNIPAYSLDGTFLWGKFYGIHSSGNIKDILKRRKDYIKKEYEKMQQSGLIKNWINEFITKGEVDDFKLYNQAFKFISNIIEYRIPFYIGFYVSVFRLYCKKNDIIYDDSYDIIDISNSLENKNIGEDYNNLIEYGFSLDMIKKIKDGNDENELLDDYEKIIYDEYKSLID